MTKLKKSGIISGKNIEVVEEKKEGDWKSPYDWYNSKHFVGKINVQH